MSALKPSSPPDQPEHEGTASVTFTSGPSWIAPSSVYTHGSGGSGSTSVVQGEYAIEPELCWHCGRPIGKDKLVPAGMGHMDHIGYCEHSPTGGHQNEAEAKIWLNSHAIGQSFGIPPAVIGGLPSLIIQESQRHLGRAMDLEYGARAPVKVPEQPAPVNVTSLTPWASARKRWLDKGSLDALTELDQMPPESLTDEDWALAEEPDPVVRPLVPEPAPELPAPRRAPGYLIAVVLFVLINVVSSAFWPGFWRWPF